MCVVVVLGDLSVLASFQRAATCPLIYYIILLKNRLDLFLRIILISFSIGGGLEGSPAMTYVVFGVLSASKSLCGWPSRVPLKHAYMYVGMFYNFPTSRNGISPFCLLLTLFANAYVRTGDENRSNKRETVAFGANVFDS